MPQITRLAVERNEDDRAKYKMIVGEHFRPGHLVFADESHFNRLSLSAVPRFAKTHLLGNFQGSWHSTLS